MRRRKAWLDRSGPRSPASEVGIVCKNWSNLPASQLTGWVSLAPESVNDGAISYLRQQVREALIVRQKICLTVDSKTRRGCNA